MYEETLSNSTSASVICLYPLSGQYELLQRILYWVIVTFTIFWHSHRWLVAGAFATVMLYSSTAAIHAIILYGARSKAFYDADAVAICEIVICSAVLIPAYLAHSKNLDQLVKRILLQTWGSFLFLGGLVGILLMTHVVKRTHPESYPCGDWTGSNWTMLDMASWSSESHWTNVIATFSTWLGYCSVLVIVVSIMFPAGTQRRREWQQEQIKKQRRTGRAKGNHPADTLQLPAVIMGGIAFAACCEKTLSLIPKSESPAAIGQWGTWAQLAMVLFASLILRLLTVEVVEADIPSMRKVFIHSKGTRGTQTTELTSTDVGASTDGGVQDVVRNMPRNIAASIVKRFTDPVTKLERGNVESNRRSEQL